MFVPHIYVIFTNICAYQSEFAELVLAARPFVIRKGADHFGLNRVLWTQRNFLAQYRDSRVLVNSIP